MGRRQMLCLRCAALLSLLPASVAFATTDTVGPSGEYCGTSSSTAYLKQATFAPHGWRPSNKPLPVLNVSFYIHTAREERVGDELIGCAFEAYTVDSSGDISILGLPEGQDCIAHLATRFNISTTGLRIEFNRAANE